MNTQSFFTFLLLVSPFVIAFLLEGVVLYFAKLKRFWPAVGLSIIINVLSLAVLYGASLLIGKLGYEFNGLQLHLPVILTLWWVSVVADGLLLGLLVPTAAKKTVWMTSILMNAISYLFLSFFILNSH